MPVERALKASPFFTNTDETGLAGDNNSDPSHRHVYIWRLS